MPKLTIKADVNIIRCNHFERYQVLIFVQHQLLDSPATSSPVGPVIANAIDMAPPT